MNDFSLAVSSDNLAKTEIIIITGTSTVPVLARFASPAGIGC